MKIRSIDESPDELAAFVNRVWHKDYAGRMIVPRWRPEYLEHELAMGNDSQRRHLLGAYDSSRLAAVLLGVRQEFLVDGQQRSGLLSSWLTVEPEDRGKQLVPQLKDEQVRRLQDEGGEVILSYRYHGSQHSLADRPQRRSGDVADRDVRRVGLWVRLLDAARAEQWYLNAADRWLTRLGKPFLRGLDSSDSRLQIRSMTAEDIDGCVTLIRRAAGDATLAIDWTSDNLRDALLGGDTSAIIGCRADEIVALLSWKLVHYIGRIEQPVAVIDLMLIDELPHDQRVAFLSNGLARMRDAGGILAMKMGLGEVSTTALLASGFIPRRRDSLQVLRWLAPGAASTLRGKQLVYWR